MLLERIEVRKSFYNEEGPYIAIITTVTEDKKGEIKVRLTGEDARALVNACIEHIEEAASRALDEIIREGMNT